MYTYIYPQNYQREHPGFLKKIDEEYQNAIGSMTLRCNYHFKKYFIYLEKHKIQGKCIYYQVMSKTSVCSA